jgi:D-alanine-D-alanine ligase
MTALSVAVVQGGPSSEAEVSRASAASVARSLTSAGHRVVRLELDPLVGESLRTGGYDVVFPVVHGAVGEDGSLQGLLEILELPYVGSGVLASALAMNKPVAKLVFEHHDLPIASGRTLARPAAGEADTLAVLRARELLQALGDRLVVKPSSSGSAIGVSRFDVGCDEKALAGALLEAWKVDDGALVECFAPGREVTCGVLEDDEGRPHALPPTEIRAAKDAFYTYEARYAPGRSEHRCPAPLGEELAMRVQEVAVRAHRALGCRDLSRADLIVGEHAITLLEVNTMPGFTETSLFPEAAGVSGVSVVELCSRLVLKAHRRGPARRNAPRPLPRES